MRRGKLSSVLVGFAAAGVVFAALFWFVGVEDVLAALARASLPLVGVVAATIVAWLLAWGLALRCILAALGVDLSSFDSVLVTAAAAFINHVVPFGQASSEPVTAWLLTDISDTEFETALASIASLDALNFVPSLSFAVVGVGYYATAVALSDGLAVLVASVIVAAVGLPLLAALAWRRRVALQRRLVSGLTPVIRRISGVLPGDPLEPDEIATRIGNFVEAVERVAGDRRRVAAALAFSATGWACQALGLWVALLAVGASVPIYIPFFVVPIGTTASIVPTPGGLGGIETVNITLLVLVTSVSPTIATAAVTIHSVGGFFLTNSLGAAAAATIKIRGASIVGRPA
ncbi:lysylphosphatidylglycerol synthase transmembrane domain-containing protein [Halococcus sp. PRR34]|uniref:lysylphosphatidylglycerol synthase transmembrane domain-containing protein n=1 Tax=Halococcus sp. PRR34 TaxID=3020830 RepID=UPI002362C642|nr:lysylphosphatidylglycerol synthase transmembrane domain-containing protein [Halococcus sp. PRR34]